MARPPIAPPLAQALEARGYTQLTSVQEAVLDPALAGRDLLVSAQTGSGKTLAFGLAFAPELLAATEPGATPRPAALIIAPTRELALQVAGELTWLYAATGLRLATCVGGMDYRSERRALLSGAEIVVGTPGRLRDHLERGSLDLSALAVAVLDEADEMLDLGFQDDLETLLAAAPPARRTLMFSATLPPAIEALAASYQQDAARVQIAAATRQHADITYRAISVPLREKEPAIFNLLRYHEARTAIIFVRTRQAVTHLLARLSNRGFQAAALSGEMGQAERLKALQSLKDGRARVCVATDVAARGIDLPGLDLVIHADLPLNAQVLLHRSGRTGRAGQKGVAVLVVTPAEFRKAQRLLQGAELSAEWGPPPGAEAIKALDEARLLAALSQPLAEDEDESALAQKLLKAEGAERIARAYVALWRAGRAAPEELSAAAASPSAPPPPSSPRDRSGFDDAIWFSLSVGYEDRAEARWLLPKICDAGGITKAEIGAIRIRASESFVQIAAGAAAKFPESQELQPGLRLTRLAGPPQGMETGGLDRRSPRPGKPRPERPERPARAERPERPQRPARAERPERATFADRDTRPERAERPERAPRPPRGEGASRPDRGARPAWKDRPTGAAKGAADRRESAPGPRRDDRPFEKRPAKADFRRPGEAPAKGAPRPATGYGAPAKAGASAKKRPYDPARADRPAKAETGEKRPYGGNPAGKPSGKPSGKPGGKPGAPGAKAKGPGFKGPGKGPAKAPGKFAGGEARPRRPAPDPRDTSRRFTPPKKPKT